MIPNRHNGKPTQGCQKFILENVHFKIIVPSSKPQTKYFAWKILFGPYTKRHPGNLGVRNLSIKVFEIGQFPVQISVSNFYEKSEY